MNGKMSEAKAGEVTMLDVDVKTFVNFSQWLYTRCYDVLYSEGVSQLCQQRRNKPEDRPRPWNYGLSAKESKDKEKTMRLLGMWQHRITYEDSEEFNTVSCSPHKPVHCGRKKDMWKAFIQPSSLTLAPPPRKSSREITVDWSEVLLSHARLYCFADKYGIISLRKLCSDAVRVALIDFECEGDQMDVLVQMIYYTMENTPPTTPPDDSSLRTIVLDFTVIVFEALIERESFKELLHMNNDLSVELLTLVTKRFD